METRFISKLKRFSLLLVLGTIISLPLFALNSNPATSGDNIIGGVYIYPDWCSMCSICIENDGLLGLIELDYSTNSAKFKTTNGVLELTSFTDSYYQNIASTCPNSAFIFWYY